MNPHEVLFEIIKQPAGAAPDRPKAAKILLRI